MINSVSEALPHALGQRRIMFEDLEYPLSACLVTYGDVLIEVDARVEAIPKAGRDAIVTDLRFMPGGSAANCAAVAAKLGARARFLGLVGQDTFGAMLIQDLEHHGVDISGLRTAAGPTAVAIIIIDSAGERTFLSFRGVGASAPYGPPPASLLQAGDCLHISGYSFQTPYSRDTALCLIAAAQEVGARISVDPSFHFARQVMTEFRYLLDGIDFFTPNQEEAFQITGIQEPTDAAERLRSLGIGTVLLKLGREGCLIATQLGIEHIPAYSVPRVIDTTGAGDAFAGGFLAATLKDCRLEEATCVGHAAAALVVAKVGGHAGAPTVSELRDFAREQQDAGLLATLTKLES